MSRGFVREGDQEEMPYVAPRAFLPQGVTNYVTQKGLDALLAEKEELIQEKEQFENHNENDRRVAVNHINAKLQLLQERINSARVINLSDQPQDEIRFGATIELIFEASAEVQILQITGVDEADISKGKLSFVSPLAKVLSNKRPGDRVSFRRANETVVYVIGKVSY